MHNLTVTTLWPLKPTVEPYTPVSLRFYGSQARAKWPIILDLRPSILSPLTGRNQGCGRRVTGTGRIDTHLYGTCALARPISRQLPAVGRERSRRVPVPNSKNTGHKERIFCMLAGKNKKETISTFNTKISRVRFVKFELWARMFLFSV